MKSIFKKTLVLGIISTAMTVSMSISASAACPITSLFSGGNLFSAFKNNGTSSSSPVSSIGNIFNNNTTSNSSCGSTNSILNILMGKTNGSNCGTGTTCTTGNCNTNSNCPNGNCGTNVNCPNGNCGTNVNCPNGNCDTNVNCPNGNCDTNVNCPNGDCGTTGNVSTGTENYAVEVLKYVNEARAVNGLSALKLDSKLNNAAATRAMEVGTKFSHTRPDGTSCFTVLKEYGITYNSCGENIASGYKTAKAVVDAWLASPGHKANIMNKNFKYMGISKNGTNWGQLFIG